MIHLDGLASRSVLLSLAPVVEVPLPPPVSIFRASERLGVGTLAALPGASVQVVDDDVREIVRETCDMVFCGSDVRTCDGRSGQFWEACVSACV